jgi:acylphosphatase
MHDIAPHTTVSDRAASHSRQRPAIRPRASARKIPLLVPNVPPAPALKTTADPSPPRALAQVAELDEGDIVLHVLGTGLGPVFCAFVCEVAMRLGLRGWSRCESGALTIRAVGREAELTALVHEIRVHAPADCSIRGIEPDVGDGGAPLPDHGFIPITGDMAAIPLATGTSSSAGVDW